MADKDTVTKDYIQNNEIFADVINFYIYGGEQIIDPKQLRPLDTTAIALPFGNDTDTKPVQKYRDVIKLLTAKADDDAAYVIYGIELQSEKHYAMPVRTMLYDAMQYSGQVEKTAGSHRKNKDKANSPDEYLSGFYKTDRLIPVITLVIYFGADRWDAPKSVYDMFDVKDKRILKYIQDYRINLIEPAAIPDEDFAKFRTELCQVFKYIKYSADKNKLPEMMNEDISYRNISRKTANMINTVTNSNIKIDNGKETIDMCEAIKGIREDGRNEGLVQGRNEGLIQGRNEGLVQGRNEGLVQGRNEGLALGEINGKRNANTETAKKVLTLGKLSFEEIAAIYNLTLEEVQELAAQV